MNSALHFDSRFGNEGVVKDHFGFSNNEAPISTAVQSDGKILTLGEYNNGFNTDFAVARYLADGKPDDEFGFNGVMTIDFGFNDVAKSMKLRQDGMILVAGSADDDFALARVNQNGVLDSGFGSNGKAVVDFGNTIDYASELVPNLDGSFYVAGTSQLGSLPAALVAKFNDNATLNTSFGSQGFVRFVADSQHDKAYVEAMAVAPNGDLVLFGRSIHQFSWVVPQLGLFGINPAGNRTFTRSFYAYPADVHRGPSLDLPHDISIQSDGSMAVSISSHPDLLGSPNHGPSNVAIGYLNSVGSSYYFAQRFTTTNDLAGELFRQADGKFVVAAQIDNKPSFVRFAGVVDQTFGENGVVGFGNQTGRVNAIAQYPDGRFVAAGYCDSSTNGRDLLLARAFEYPIDVSVNNVQYVSDSHFQFDYSINGVIPATTFRLVQSRDLVFDASDAFVDELTVSTLTQGNHTGSFQRTGGFVLDHKRPFFLVVADFGDAIFESLENNNTTFSFLKRTYMFIDFGQAFPIVDVAGGPVKALRDETENFHSARFSTGLDSSPSNMFQVNALSESLKNFPISEEDFIQVVLSIVSKDYFAFSVEVVLSSISNLDQVLDIFAEGGLDDPNGKNDAYCLAGGIHPDGNRLFGRAPAFELLNGSNRRDDGVFVFAETIIQASLLLGLRGENIPDTVAQVLSHEAGHAFGLSHAYNDPTFGFSAEILSRNEIMGQFVYLENGIIDKYFSRVPVYDSVDELGLLFPGNTFVPFEILAQENNLGLRSGVPAFVSGSGGFDVISVTAVSTIEAVVLVKTFKEITHDELISSYEYSISTLSGISIEMGQESDEFIVDSAINIVSVSGNDGRDSLVIEGTAGADILSIPSNFQIESLEEMTINLVGGDDFVELSHFEYSGQFWVFVGDGDDIVVASSFLGQTLIFGGIGNDRIIASKRGSVIYGGLGNDELIGQDANDRIYGQSGNDNILGGNGDDILDGGVGVDSIFGELGDDVLFGGQDLDADELWGGSGADLFVLRSAADVIRDFEASINRRDRDRRR